MDSQETDRILKLTGRIYDAALDAQLWSGALEEVCSYVGGSAANLFSQDIESGCPAVVFQWGNDPDYETLYREKYYRLNPLAPAMASFEVGMVHSQSDMMPYEEFYRTRFYQEWVKPQGIIDVVGANLDRTATRFAMLAIRQYERDGRVTEDTRRRVGMIVPHVRRAIAIGQVLDFNSSLATALTEALDALKSGVALVDARGDVSFANESAAVLFESGGLVQRVDNRFVAHDPKARKALSEAFAAAVSGDAALGTKGAAIPMRAACGERWIANVLPLTSGARRQAGRRHAAVAAVFMRRAALNAPAVMAQIGRSFRLTPGEQRVLNAIVEVGGVAATAGALGLSETTVKTHLQNLYVKTGVNRQAELVKLVATASQNFSG